MTRVEVRRSDATTTTMRTMMMMMMMTTTTTTTTPSWAMMLRNRARNAMGCAW